MEDTKEKLKGLKQVPVRVHENDYRAFKKLAIDDGLNFQKFVSACFSSYLARDPLLLKVIGDWKTENELSRDKRKRLVPSKREADALLDEISSSED